MSKNVFHQLFLGLDQLANVCLGGYADETLSARCYRQGVRTVTTGLSDRWSVAWAVVDTMFAWQDWLIQRRTGRAPEMRHCQRAYVSELLRMQCPPEYRVMTSGAA